MWLRVTDDLQSLSAPGTEKQLKCELTMGLYSSRKFFSSGNFMLYNWFSGTALGFDVSPAGFYKVGSQLLLLSPHNRVNTRRALSV